MVSIIKVILAVILLLYCNKQESPPNTVVDINNFIIGINNANYDTSKHHTVVCFADKKLEKQVVYTEDSCHILNISTTEENGTARESTLYKRMYDCGCEICEHSYDNLAPDSTTIYIDYNNFTSNWLYNTFYKKLDTGYVYAGYINNQHIQELIQYFDVLTSKAYFEAIFDLNFNLTTITIQLSTPFTDSFLHTVELNY